MAREHQYTVRVFVPATSATLGLMLWGEHETAVSSRVLRKLGDVQIVSIAPVKQTMRDLSGRWNLDGQARQHPTGQRRAR